MIMGTSRYCIDNVTEPFFERFCYLLAVRRTPSRMEEKLCRVLEELRTKVCAPLLCASESSAVTREERDKRENNWV
jgi:hypothetical protein